MDHIDLELMLDKELEEKILEEALKDEINKQNKKTLNEDKARIKSKQKKRKIRSKKIKDSIKIRTILLLIITLIANTYAWFVYITAAFSSIDMHIRGWDIAFTADDQEEDFVFSVEQLFPGMDDVKQSVAVSNNGESPAEIKAEVSYIRIFDEEYTANEVNADGSTYTSQQLLNKLLNEYPFKIEMYINEELYDGTTVFKLPVGEATSLDFTVRWPFETGTTKQQIEANDAIDTEWGEKAYAYYQENPDSNYTIEVKMHITAAQIVEEETDDTNTTEGENTVVDDTTATT